MTLRPLLPLIAGILTVVADRSPCDVVADVERLKSCRCVTGCTSMANTVSREHVINAAFNKPARASSLWADTRTYRACALVNGRKRANISFAGSVFPNCLITDHADFRAWWQVDLLRPYTIADLHIYPHDEANKLINYERLRGITIYVDGQHCISFLPYSTPATEVKETYSQWLVDGLYFKVPCGTPITGRVVRIQKAHNPHIHPSQYLYLCEVVINVCEPGYYLRSGQCVQGEADCPYPIDNVYGCPGYPGRLANVAINTKPWMISVSGDTGAHKSVDGLPWITDPDCSITGQGLSSQVLWWKVDLSRVYRVFHVVVINRAANQERLNDLWVHVEKNFFTIGEEADLSSTTPCFHFVGRFGHQQNMSCYDPKPLARYVVVSVPGTAGVLQLCEVQVFAQVVRVVEVGRTLPQTSCNLTVCDSGAEPEGDVCRLKPGESCQDRQTLCHSGHVCEALQCRIDVDGDCSGSRFSLCRQGAACDWTARDGPKCRLRVHSACNSSAQCMGQMTCDLLGTCKSGLGATCFDSNTCPAGAWCDAKRCTCNMTLTEARGGECVPLQQVYGGRCSDDLPCLGQHAVCDSTSSTCRCAQGYAAFPGDLSCRVKAGMACRADEECNQGLVCAGLPPPSAKCRVRVGGGCRGNEGWCVDNATCDTDGLCRITLTASCGADDGRLCVAGAECDSSVGQCRNTAGRPCLGSYQCVHGTRCGLSETCEVRRGQSCSGDRETLCEPGSVCDKDGTCRTRVGEACDDTDAADCQLWSRCDGGRCRLVLGAKCGEWREACGDDAVCDVDDRCRLVAGSRCAMDRDLCSLGSACSPASHTCECGAGTVSKGGVCRQGQGQLGGNCSNDCTTPFSLCLPTGPASASCQCDVGYSVSANSTCAPGPGTRCTGATTCATGSVCDVTGTCRLQVGESCSGDLGAHCRSGAVCEQGEVCRANLQRSCHHHPNGCRTNTVCDPLTRTCKLPLEHVGCLDDGQCVSGAACNVSSHVCECRPGLGSGGGAVCLVAGGRTGGACNSTCRDVNAVCDGDPQTCRCRAGWTVDGADLACRLPGGAVCGGAGGRCVSGTRCQAGVCRVEVGGPCLPSRDQPCVDGAVCDKDSTCKLDMGQPCEGRGDDVGVCRIGTLCDSLGACKLGRGYLCNGTLTRGPFRHCVAGAACSTDTFRCQCQPGVSRARGALCVPGVGRAGGTCGVGDSCVVSGAVCRVAEARCRCSAGFLVNPFTYGCDSPRPVTGRQDVLLPALLASAVLLLAIAGGVVALRRQQQRQKTARPGGKAPSKQPAIELDSEPVSESATEPGSKPVSEPTTELASKPAPESAPESVSEPVTESTTELISEPSRQQPHGVGGRRAYLQASSSTAGSSSRAGLQASSSTAGSSSRAGLQASSSTAGSSSRAGLQASSSTAGSSSRAGLQASSSTAGSSSRAGLQASSSTAGSSSRAGLQASSSTAGSSQVSQSQSKGFNHSQSLMYECSQSQYSDSISDSQIYNDISFYQAIEGSKVD